METTNQGGLNQAQGMLEALFARVPANTFITLSTKEKSKNGMHSSWYQADAVGIAQLVADGIVKAPFADVYFSTCPALRPLPASGNRRISQKDVVCIPALYVDVDTQEDPSKAGESLPLNRVIAMDTLRAIPSPPPIMVDSGHGIHGYWPMEKPFPPNEGKRVLRAFLEAVKKTTGWMDLDSASEPARILRLPGTYNHKGADPLPVTILSISDKRFSLAEIEDFIRAVDQTVQGEEQGQNNDELPDAYESAWLGAEEPDALADDALIAKAMCAKNGQRFTDLWNGKTAAYKSQSEAELALCGFLAFWTRKDAFRIDCLYRKSGLHRAKWDERHSGDGRTYGEITIQYAIEKTKNEYSPRNRGDDRVENENMKPFYAAYGKVPGFGMRNGQIFAEKSTKDGIVETPLATGSALIREEITRDDGVDSWKEFKIEGADRQGGFLPAVNVKTSDYDRMDWTKKAWGTAFNIYPGPARKDQLRFSIIEASRCAEPPMQHRAVYAHTGWRDIYGQRVFLFNGGAVGAEGVNVELDGNLSSYRLPPVTGDTKVAIAASLELLEVGPCRVTGPVFAHTYLAPLCHFLHKGKIPPAFVLFLSGGTGTRKTTLAALEMAHYGTEWSATRMPASFADTASSIRNKAFICKDVPLLVDDYHPASNPKQKATMNQTAHDIATGWGDYSERGRLRADLTLATAKPPRGLGLITGEDAPNVTESGTARYYVIEVKRNDLPVSEALQRVQASASSGLLAGAMRAYIEYLATIPEGELIKMLVEAFTEYRSLAQTSLQGAHGRLAGAAAWLWIGLRYALNCFVSYGAITEAQSQEYFEVGRRAILDNVSVQQEDMRQEKPSKMYIQAIYDLIAAGKCRLHPVASDSAVFDEIIGYHDERYIYLIPGAAYFAVFKFYQEQGSAFPISRLVLNKRLAEEGVIDTKEGEGYTQGKYIAWNKKTMRLLHMRRDVLAPQGCDPALANRTGANKFTAHPSRDADGLYV